MQKWLALTSISARLEAADCFRIAGSLAEQFKCQSDQWNAFGEWMKYKDQRIEDLVLKLRGRETVELIVGIHALHNFTSDNN